MFVAGYMGWAVYGALSSFNVLYYFDIYKRQYMDTSFASWDSNAFKSVWGGASYIRLHFNMLAWVTMLFGWALSCIGWKNPELHVFFHGMAEVMIAIWLLRILLVMFMQVISLMVDNYSVNHAQYNYFSSQAWGSELHIEDLYDTLDIELEAWNILGQIIGYGLYSIGLPLFHAQINETEVIQANGASCRLCFKRRGLNDDVEQGTVDET